MVRGAAIGFVVSILLTTVATWLMSTETIHAQQGPQHVFSGYVSNHRQPLNDGFVRVTIGPGFGLQPSVQEVAYEDIRQGRYKLAVEDPTRGNHWAKTHPGSPVMLKFTVTYQGREYQRSREVRLEPGKVTELNFDIEGWLWHQAQPQRLPNQPQNDGGMNANQQARFEMERERMEREEEMRREQMESEAEMRREQMQRGQRGVQPVAGGKRDSGPSRGLFSNRAAGEATSGIDNIMDPTMLTIIGIALTVLTTGMTLFKGD